MKINSEYQCLNCGHRWLNCASPQECPICKHLYVKLIGRSEYYPFSIKMNADGWYDVVDVRSNIIIEEDLTLYTDAEIISAEKQKDLLSQLG